MLNETYCLLTGGRCCHYPLTPQLNSFFISEPFDISRKKREKAIIRAIQGNSYIIADHRVRPISITCKICQQIQSSMFGIVDISGFNANVLIELGMLFGFNKPTIIVVQRKEKVKIDIPSNIIGIEQIRYSTYSQLATKLVQAVGVLFKITKEEEEYLLDLEPILDFQIHRLEVMLEAKKLPKQFESRIIDFKLVNNTGYVIMDKGTTDGIRDEMLFTVFQASNKVGELYLEEQVGLIIVTHAQDKISQCQAWSYDPSNEFWTDTFYAKPPRNILKVHIPEDINRMTEKAIEDTISAYKLMLSYNLAGQL